MNPLITEVTITKKVLPDDYRDFPGLSPVIEEVKQKARRLRQRLDRRRLWMINSTERGGGIAEMLPTLIRLLRELKMPISWLVITPRDPLFFIFTKKLHHLLHGRSPGNSKITPEEKMVYETDSQAIAQALAKKIRNGDIVVVHDPQPLGAGFYLQKLRPKVRLLWRCHIGTEFANKYTERAWDFLKPYLTPYQKTFFTHPDYTPPFLRKKNGILYPAIDPLSAKNDWLSTDELTGILQKSALDGPRRRGFKKPVQRLLAGGRKAVPAGLAPITTPYVLQISRFDHLKGFIPLMKGFLYMKEKVKAHHYRGVEALARHMIRDSVLVLAGPEIGQVADDPEPAVVLKEILDFYRTLPKKHQRQIYLLLLPMASLKENALICNALQRCATVIVQNSIREGFGLTVTEALWKEVPVLAAAVGGIRLQVLDRQTGILIRDPLNDREVGEKLLYMLTHHRERSAMVRKGWLKAIEDFLTPVQLRRYLDIFETLTSSRSPVKKPGR